MRMLFESNGAREDPATGSAATCLGAYLLEHRVLAGGAADVRVEQGKAVRRPSLLFVRARAGAQGYEVDVGGHVITTARGELV